MYSSKISEIDVLQKEINSYRPFKKEEIIEFRNYLRIGLTYSSNALEGNSLTETETKIILEDGITIGGKTLREHFEVIGHGQAYDFLFTLIENKTITEENILQIHKLFYYHIDQPQAGIYRNQQVFITGTDFIPPSPTKVPMLMKTFVDNIESLKNNNHPVEYAALLHKELVTIHPFVDGNGRTARLLMNLALLQNSYVMTIIPPILRNDYLTTLKQSQTGSQDNHPFINFISCMVYEAQKDCLRMLRTFRNV